MAGRAPYRLSSRLFLYLLFFEGADDDDSGGGVGVAAVAAVPRQNSKEVSPITTGLWIDAGLCVDVCVDYVVAVDMYLWPTQIAADDVVAQTKLAEVRKLVQVVMACIVRT